MESHEEYDAIWFGGGASGRFGAAFLKALGGNPLIIEKECLGGECHVCRCAFENFISDQSSMAELLHLYSGKSWYPEFDLSKISMAKAVETYRKVGQTSFKETMKHQTETQSGSRSSGEREESSIRIPLKSTAKYTRERIWSSEPAPGPRFPIFPASIFRE